MTEQNIEEVEAIENEAELHDYPLDSFLIRTENRTIFEIMRRMQGNAYILDPDFQREFVWDETKQSRLVESALMRIPLPVFYLAERPDGKIVVVDGLQRLTTFYRYFNNEFALKDIHNQQLIGKRFDDLTPKLKARLEDTVLTLYLIDSAVPERARLDIFERVNSGVPLSRQQMRNSLYSGPATLWLKDQSKSDLFQQATTRSLDWRTMRDRELINRFCGFHLLGYEAYGNRFKGDMDAFLASTLECMNELPKSQLQTLEDVFQTSMANNYTVFETYAFRRHLNQHERRSVINAALFDLWSVTMAQYSEDCVQEHQDTFRNIFYDLMRDNNFNDMISIATNSVRKVRGRFELMERKLRESRIVC